MKASNREELLVPYEQPDFDYRCAGVLLRDRVARSQRGLFRNRSEEGESKTR
jgi:hypothetical protein